MSKNLPAPRFAAHAAALAGAVLLICALSLAGCRRAPAPAPVDNGPRAAFIAFQQHYCMQNATAAGLSLKASLYYTRMQPTRRSNRTVLDIWGDLDGSMRLDLRAGIGTILMMLRQDEAGLLAYYPGDQVAFTHQDPVLGAQMLGLPFPFSLPDLALALSGDFSTLVPGQYDAATALAGGGYEYTFAQGPVRGLRLDAFSRPVYLEGLTTVLLPGNEERAWTLSLEKYPEEPGEEYPNLARKLTLELSSGESAVLRIKSFALRPAAWQAQALALELPRETRILALEDFTPPDVLAAQPAEDPS